MNDTKDQKHEDRQRTSPSTTYRSLFPPDAGTLDTGSAWCQASSNSQRKGERRLNAKRRSGSS